MTTITPTTSSKPFLVMADLVRLHAGYEQTDGGFFAMEVTVAPGGGPPPLHTHAAAEFFWTLEGELTYFREETEGSLTEIDGGPGTSALIPAACRTRTATSPIGRPATSGSSARRARCRTSWSPPASTPTAAIAARRRKCSPSAPPTAW